MAVALAHGLAIGLMVAALGHISGGHFNPAVTISMLATGEVGISRAVSYIIAQLLGGLAGAGILTLIFPALGPMGRNNIGVNLGVLGLGPDVTASGAVIAEVVMTFFLVLVISGRPSIPRGPAIALGNRVDDRDGHSGRRPRDGSGDEPARWFGPALVQQDFANWWIYWVGPIIGGLIAAFAYKYIWLPEMDQPWRCLAARLRSSSHRLRKCSNQLRHHDAVVAADASRIRNQFRAGFHSLRIVSRICSYLRPAVSGLANRRLKDGFVELRSHTLNDLAIERLVRLQLAVEGAELRATLAAESVADRFFSLRLDFLSWDFLAAPPKRLATILAILMP